MGLLRLITRIDANISVRVFTPVAAKCRDWLGCDQWKLSREAANGAALISIFSLILALSSTAWWLSLIWLASSVGFWWFQQRQIRIISAKGENAWLYAFLEEAFGRMYLVGYWAGWLLSVPFQTRSPDEPHGAFIACGVFAYGVFNVASYYFRTVIMPPPPPPKEEMSLVPVRIRS